MQNKNICNKYFRLFLLKVLSACLGEQILYSTEQKKIEFFCRALLNWCFNMLCFTAILAGDKVSLISH
jgi:hypothetical protein